MGEVNWCAQRESIARHLVARMFTHTSVASTTITAVKDPGYMSFIDLLLGRKGGGQTTGNQLDFPNTKENRPWKKLVRCFSSAPNANVESLGGNAKNAR